MKIKKGLSAGRVQSVATRMIVDREQEIETFEPEEYWHVETKLHAGSKKLTAKLHSIDGERVSISSQEQAEAAKARIAEGGFTVKSVKRGERRKHPAAPFTTSNLQHRPAASWASPRAKPCRSPSSSTKAWMLPAAVRWV